MSIRQTRRRSGSISPGRSAADTSRAYRCFRIPRDHQDIWWFVAGWGVITVGPFRMKEALVRRGEHLHARYRVIVHDAYAAAANVAAAYAEFLKVTAT